MKHQLYHVCVRHGVIQSIAVLQIISVVFEVQLEITKRAA